MKHLLLATGVLAFLLSMTSTAVATVTVTFDPNDILDRYAADAYGSKTSQADARRVHASWGNPFYGTFSDYMQSGHTQNDDYNTYVNWRNSLQTEGEGIAMFNSWFLDQSPVRSWGEIVVIKPGTTVTGTAASGWNVRVIDSPYGLGGSSVQWWTTHSANRLRPTSLGGMDVGLFSITADLYYDYDNNGWTSNDTQLTYGDAVRFWLGNLNGDDAEFFRTDTQAIYFDDQGFGSLSPSYGTFGAIYSNTAGVYGSGFECALDGRADVPEPGTCVLLGLGLGAMGLGACRRLRRAA